MNKFLFVFLVLMLVVGVGANCRNGDDDDNDDDVDTGDDDTSVGGPDDDALSDDDMIVRRVNKKAVSDDAGLFLIGWDGNQYTSWLKSGGSWQRFDIPQVETTETERAYFGPVLVVDGEVLYTVWNVIDVPNPYQNETVRHQWLVFDPTDGWRFDTKQPTGDGQNVELIGLSSDGVFWAGTYYRYSWSTPPSSGSESASWLYRYESDEPELELDLPRDSFEAWAMPAAGGGWLSVYRNRLFFNRHPFFKYSGGQWTQTSVPPEHEDAWFLSLLTEDAVNGYGIMFDHSETRRTLLSISPEQWVELQIPEECNEPTPMPFHTLTGSTTHFVIYQRGYLDNRFVVVRDGEWTCRRIPGYLYDYGVDGALVLNDGRVYLSVDIQSKQSVMVVEVTADHVLGIALPADLTRTAPILTAFGPDAPSRQFVPR